MFGDLEGMVRPIKPWAALSLHRRHLAQVSMAGLALLDRMLNHHIGMVHRPQGVPTRPRWPPGFFPLRCRRGFAFRLRMPSLEGGFELLWLSWWN